MILKTQNTFALENKSDFEIVENIKNKQDESDVFLDILSERHTGIFISALSHYENKLDRNFYSEFLSDKIYHIYDAAIKFDEKKNVKFSTFLFNSVKWKCLKEISKPECKENPCDSEVIESLMNKIKNKENVDEKEFLIKLIIDQISLIEDERAREILQLRYFSVENKNLSWNIISEKVGLSIQGCINVHNKYINKISKNIKNILNK